MRQILPTVSHRFKSAGHPLFWCCLFFLFQLKVLTKFQPLAFCYKNNSMLAVHSARVQQWFWSPVLLLEGRSWLEQCSVRLVLDSAQKSR